MNPAIEHAAQIELVRAKAAGPLPAITQTLEALVCQLRAQINQLEGEAKRLEVIETEAHCVYAYYCSGRGGDPTYDPEWDNDLMSEKLDALGEALNR